MFEIRNTSQEPLVLRLSTYAATVELDPGKVVEIQEYEPGMTLEIYPKYDAQQPRRGRVGLAAVREG